MKKKIVSLLTALILFLSVTACIPISSNQYDTITGKVTAVEGSTVTIAVVTQNNDNNENSNQGELPPEIPDGNNEEQGELPPEIPDDNGEEEGELPPEIPDDNEEQGEIPPEIPDDNEEQGELPPEIPEDNGGEQGEIPPDKPDGENEEQGEIPPEIPDDDNQQGGSQNQGGVTFTGETKTLEITDTSILYKKESGTETTATLADIVINSFLTVTYKNNSQITKIVITSESDFNGNGGGEQSDGGDSSNVIYGGAKEITTATEEISKSYTSSTVDQSALLINTSGNVTITNPTVTKTGSSNGGDNCNFYGQNAALLVKGGSTTTITGGTITSNATGANGVFSYGGNGGQNGATGDGTKVIISNTVITTMGNGSGGIMTTGGGITEATNLTITTSGQSSAAIRTDRGGGTVTVTGGTYTTNGLGSPTIYSTANITVSNAELISNLSEGVCIEGLNSITLNNTSLTANNTQRNGNAKFCDTVMIYQSMSGDAESGTSSFTMNNGSILSKNGHIFHITNTSAVITLNGVNITNQDSDNILLSVCDDGWSGGSNVATLNATNQTLNGGILVGNDSTLTMTLSNGSSFTGYISGNITNESGAIVSNDIGTVSVTLESGCTWTLTADTYISSFSGNASSIIANGHTLYVNGVALTGTN